MASVRRGAQADAWLQQLERDAGSGPPTLVRAASGKTFVLEGTHRREVPAGLLVPALEQALGEARLVDEVEFNSWTESAPVEVLEGPKGRPFVIVGGKRRPLRGLPLPHPVSAEQMDSFPEGPELNVAATNVSRARLQSAVSGRYHRERMRALMRSQGPVRGAATIVRRGAARLFGSAKGGAG